MINISVVQFTPVFGKRQDNLGAIVKMLGDLETDIIVLPELCTTGYSFLSREEAVKAAEGRDGETIATFKKLAEKLGAVIVAGFVEKEGDKVYNAALAALPDGQVKIYRKTHLFYKETVCFDQGDSGFFVVHHPFKDCKIGIMVCNDWRYPEAARSLALLGADIIACPSNLVSLLWGIAMPARALENKVYLAVANRCGTEIREMEDHSEQALTFNGNSVLYDYNGSEMERADRAGDKIFTVAIDPIQTRDKWFNNYNDLLKDRRPSLYITE